MKRAFVLPNTLGNSGGVKIVCEYTNRMQEMGIECDLIYPIIPANYKRNKFKSPYKVLKFFGTIILNIFSYNKAKFEEKYKNLKIKRIWNLDKLNTLTQVYDVMYATGWETYYYISKLSVDKRYFVQSIETWDGPKDLVLKTYEDIKFQYYIITKELEKSLKENVSKNIIYNPIEMKINHIKKNELADFKFGVIYRNGTNKNFKSIVGFLKENKEYRNKFVCLARKIPYKYKKYFAKIYDGNTEVNKFYFETSCFIMPSLHEGFGLPILEAMDYENLLISNKTGILSDFEYDIEFVDLKKKSLFEAIKIIERLSDIEKKEKVKNNNLFMKEYAKKNSWEKNIDILK